jgi:hypothetical protein
MIRTSSLSDLEIIIIKILQANNYNMILSDVSTYRVSKNNNYVELSFLSNNDILIKYDDMIIFNKEYNNIKTKDIVNISCELVNIIVDIIERD